MLYLLVISFTLGTLAYKLIFGKTTLHAYLVSKGILKAKLKENLLSQEATIVEPSIVFKDEIRIKDIKIIYEEELSKLGINSLTIVDKSDVNKTNHFYKTFLSKSASDNSNKSKRLNSEIKQIGTFLPIYFTNSIFVRYDDSRMDCMKAMIMGADDTPYAHGAFLFDIYFDDAYPTVPPKVNLMTTGNAQVRFNPNLYNNGYVCLSLLGTWSGGKDEMWSNKSNLLQVLISIQSLVMNEGIIYNEPSYVSHKNNGAYKNMNNGYTNIVRYANVKYAMIEQIKNPPTGFEEIIKKHFFYKKNEILKTCQTWIAEAELVKDGKTLVDYGGLVGSHNYVLSGLFNQGKSTYYDELKKEVTKLETILNELII